MTILRTAGIALAISLLLALLSCLSPIRWDKKSMAELAPLSEVSAAGAASDFVYVSDGNDWKSGHVVAYGLKFLSFPQGKVTWLQFKEGWQAGPWQPAALIDGDGTFYRSGPRHSWIAVPEIPLSLKSLSGVETRIVASSESVRAALQARWPAARDAKVQVLDWTKGSFFESPRLRVDADQFLRLFLVSFVLVVAGGLAWRRTPTAGTDVRLFSVCMALPMVLAAHTFVAFFLGKVVSNALDWTIVVEFGAALAALFFVKGNAAALPDPADVTPEPSGELLVLKGWPVLAIAFALLAYFTISVLRLDFDGDIFSQWLPMARYYYLFGDHDLAVLLTHHGAGQITTYPPGFPIVIATLLWISDASGTLSFHLGHDSHLAVFLYRVLLVSLHLSFLCAVATFFRSRQRCPRDVSWLLPVLAIALVVPIFLGKAQAAEVFLIPIGGFAILALLAGNELADRSWLRVGLMLGAFCLFIKNESVVVFLLIVLPWYLIGVNRVRDFFVRARMIDLASIVVAALPFLYWKFELGRLGADTNFAFNSFDPALFVANPTLSANLLVLAFKTIVSSDYWVAVLLVLPAATLLVRPARLGPMALLVPAGTLGYLGLMSAIYVFSRSDPVVHLETSYERIIGIAIVSALLFGAHVLFSFQRSIAFREETRASEMKKAPFPEPKSLF